MKEEISVLKLGASKKEFPYYCQYADFTKDSIRTCNSRVYVEIDNPFDIEGDINLFVLDEILKNCNEPEIYQDGTMLKIRDGNYKTSLVIDDIEFPEMPEIENLELIGLEDIYEILKEAIKFVGSGLYSYIYLCNDCILATDKSRVFSHKLDLSLSQVVGIDKQILSALGENCKLGVRDNNTIVVYDSGVVRFQATILDNYPKSEIIKVMSKSKVNIEKLCNVYPLQQAVKKISPMLMNEQSSFIGLKNADKKLDVYVDSITNGISVMTIDSAVESKFEMSIDYTFFNNINIDYDVYVNEVENVDRLYLTNGKSDIVLLGEEV